jgi:hypothetical protein
MLKIIRSDMYLNSYAQDTDRNTCFLSRKVSHILVRTGLHRQILVKSIKFHLNPISVSWVQNYWNFGLFPSSGIIGTRKHDVSETGSVSVLRCRGKTPTQLRPNHWLALTKGPNTVGVFLPHLRLETDAVSETSCFLVPRTTDGGRSPKIQ